MSDQTESNLIRHARTELTRAGLMDPDSDYEGALGTAVMSLVTIHSTQGHSGASHAMTMGLVNQVLSFKPLTPLTDNPDEWAQHEPDLWQSTRDSEAFSKDGGRTYYLLSEARGWMRHVPRAIRLRLPSRVLLRVTYPFHRSEAA